MKKKKIFMLAALAVTGCVCGAQIQAAESPVEGKKMAYILNMPASDIFELCAAQCQETANMLGMDCDVFFSDGDEEAFWADIQACAEDGYDGLYLSHGGQGESYTRLTELLAQYPELKVVTFDTQFQDESGETKTVEGVTQFFQEDAGLAESLLDYICEELYPEKETVNILKVWVGPGYLAAFDRREEGYKTYEEAGKIHTVEVIGPKDDADAAVSMKQVMAETLEKYGEDEIDAVWAAYDVYAQGCYEALKESGKNIPLVSVDICNTDIGYMTEEDSLWKACACTDFRANGEQGVRILALELNGDYDAITAPGGSEPVNYLEMPASLITQEMVTGTTTMENLPETAPDTYGNKEDLVTADWLRDCIGY